MAEDGATRHVAAREWAASCCQRWFLDGEGRDRFRLQQIDAGWATHVEAYLHLVEVGLAVLGAPPQGRGFGPLRWLKAQGMDRAARAMALRLRARPADPTPADFAVVVEIPTPSMLEPAALVASEAGGTAVVATSDPRASARLRQRGIVAHPLVSGIGDEQRLVNEARQAMQVAWQRVAADPPQLRLDGMDVWHLARPRLERLVTRSMPYLLPERAALAAFFDRVTPRAVALASDQHRIGRLATALAGEAGIPITVLQHGLPQGTIGLLPVIADRVATWSEASSAWFVEHGTDPQRLVVAGNTRLDLLASIGVRSERDVHLLVALTPTATETNEAVVAGSIEALSYLPDARLTVKLHPGQSSWSAVERLVRERGGDRVHLRRHEPLYPMLAAASHVVLHRSTVAVEALAARRPVIVYRAGGEPTAADRELADVRLPQVENARSLAAAIGALRQRTEIHAWFAEREAELTRITGPLDGRSTARVVKLLSGIGLPASQSKHD